MSQINLHRIHGVAPMLTTCTLCGGPGEGLLLLGSACNTVCQKALGEDYSGSSVQRIPHGHCNKCLAHLKGGAAAFVCYENGSVFMFSAECVQRNKWPGGGKVNRISVEQAAEFQSLADQTQPGEA